MPPALPGEVPQVPLAYTPPAARSRVRWDRILLLVIGVGLLGFGVWNALHGSDPAAPAAAGTQPVVAGAGASTSSGARSVDVPPPVARSPRTPALRRSSAATSRRNPMQPPGAAARARARGVHTSAARRLGAPAASGRAVARATRIGGGAGAASARWRTTARGSGQLPYTGLETWIAAVLGMLALALGIAVHVNAVRIGMVAMLYRRGILLRPVECARLAQQRGLPRLRARVSRVLERLLEPPTGSDEYVSLRALHAADLPR